MHTDNTPVFQMCKCVYLANHVCVRLPYLRHHGSLPELCSGRLHTQSRMASMYTCSLLCQSNADMDNKRVATALLVCKAEVYRIRVTIALLVSNIGVHPKRVTTAVLVSKAEG